MNADYRANLQRYENISTTVEIPGSAGDTVVVAAKPGWQIFIQKIAGSINVPGDGVILETLPGADPLATTPTTAAAGPIGEIDFGPDGMAVPPDEGLNLATPATTAGFVVITMYRRPTPGTSMSPAEFAAGTTA